MYICIYIYIYIYKHTSTHTCIHVCIQLYMYITVYTDSHGLMQDRHVRRSNRVACLFHRPPEFLLEFDRRCMTSSFTAGS